MFRTLRSRTRSMIFTRNLLAPPASSLVRGVGVDVSYVPRFERLLEASYASRFFRRAFHPDEIVIYHQISARDDRLRFAASRWAVKEAAYKALGLDVVRFRDVSVSKGYAPTNPFLQRFVRGRLTIDAINQTDLEANPFSPCTIGVSMQPAERVWMSCLSRFLTTRTMPSRTSSRHAAREGIADICFIYLMLI